MRSGTKCVFVLFFGGEGCSIRKRNRQGARAKRKAVTQGPVRVFFSEDATETDSGLIREKEKGKGERKSGKLV